MRVPYCASRKDKTLSRAGKTPRTATAYLHTVKLLAVDDMVWRRKDNPRAAGPVDRTIGARIRERRLELGMSQEALAAEIGITFQQVQKYEKGQNRVAAATLVDIARALDAPFAALLPKLEILPETSLDQLGVTELMPLMKKLNPHGRRVLSHLARALAKEPVLASAQADEAN